MEKRTIEQVRTWKLILNPMTDRTEAGRIVAVSFERSRLVDWYKSQFETEPYQDNNWHKVFRKGGPLEWYNPESLPDEGEYIGSYGHGISAEWAQEDVVNGSGILIV